MQDTYTVTGPRGHLAVGGGWDTDFAHADKFSKLKRAVDAASTAAKAEPMKELVIILRRDNAGQAFAQAVVKLVATATGKVVKHAI